MNLLILSCGTRNLLVRYFKEKKNGFDKIVGTDCSTYAPALYETDVHYIVPRMTEPDYLSTILAICQKESIDAVLPLQEDELYLIAAHKNLFTENGVVPIVSEPDTVELCRDKYAFHEYLKRNGLPDIPCCVGYESFLKEQDAGIMKMPVFIKPVRGCGSIGIQKVERIELLESLCRYGKEEYLIQNFAEGEEFGADIYIDLLTKEPVTIFVKRKLRMRAGETEKSVSYKDDALFELIKKAVSGLQLCGPVDMDLFCIDGNYYISEINPRFGGGYPHAYNCGINFPKLIAVNIAGRKNETAIGSYEEGVCMLKYTDLMMRKF